jgi:hypothetical protein
MRRAGPVGLRPKAGALDTIAFVRKRSHLHLQKGTTGPGMTATDGAARGNEAGPSAPAKRPYSVPYADVDSIDAVLDAANTSAHQSGVDRRKSTVRVDGFRKSAAR